MSFQAVNLNEFQADLPDLIDWLYRSLYDETATQAFVGKIGRITNASNVVLSFSGGIELPGRFLTANGHGLIAKYLPMRWQDPWMKEVVALSDRSAVLGSEVLSKRDLKKSEVYEHIYHPLDIEYMATTASATASGLPSYLCIQRFRNDFQADVKVLLETLYPHLVRIEGVYQAYLNNSVRSSITLSMDNLGELVDHVCAQWAAVFGGLGLAEYSRQCLANAIVPRFVTPLMDEDGLFRWLVTVVPDKPGRRVSVYVRLFPELEGMEQLSPAESRLLAELIRGYSMAEIGQKFGRSRNTIKTQMKNLLSKLAFRSQRELLDHFPP